MPVSKQNRKRNSNRWWTQRYLETYNFANHRCSHKSSIASLTLLIVTNCLLQTETAPYARKHMMHTIHYTMLVFFLGCSEVSGIFLVLIDIAKFHPPEPNTIFDTMVVVIAGPCFAITFFYYRIYLWWQVSIRMYKDVYYVIKTGVAKKLRPGRDYILYFMIVGNSVLTLLQIYWFMIILQEAKKLFM